MTVLQAQEICVNLGGRRIVDRVTFRADPGRVLAIIGPNGSGKSTLLKALTGELPYAGTARFGEVSVAQTGPDWFADRRGVLPQHTEMAFPLLVCEVVRLGQDRRPHGRAERERQVSLALERVDLAGFENRRYHSLSGGEQQRVQLARVLCQVWDPVVAPSERSAPGARWLFLDEPVSSLDIRHQVQIMGIARDYARRGGGVVAVMHDLNLTAHFADDVLVLKGGQITASGPVGEVFTGETLSHAYDHPVDVVAGGGVPRVVPQFHLVT